MTKFEATALKPKFEATVTLGTGTAGGIPASPLDASVAGQGSVTGDLTSTAAGSTPLAGQAAGGAAPTGGLTVTAPSPLAGVAAGSGAAGGDLSAAPSAPISLLEVLGPTLVDATGDFGDATERPGVYINGFVAKAVMTALIAQTFDPTKITLQVSDPGYDAAGTTTVTRTITGTAILRRQYNAAAQFQQINDTITHTVWFALSDEIYAGSTIVSASAAAGFYGGSQAGPISNTVNSSTFAYPKPLFAWVNAQHERATGASYAVEAVVAHRHARNGRMVGRVEFIAKDAQASPNVAATQVASSTSLSSIQTRGNIVEAYKASIPLSALTQADLCEVNVKIYPWIGDSTAVLDLDVDGEAWPTPKPQTRLRFLNDKDGTYGGAFAFVKNGAVGGTVSLVEATARAAPFPTISAAVAALPAFNNTNRGHNDHSGSIVYLMDDAGAAFSHIIAANVTATAGKCWTLIRPDPSNTAAVTITVSSLRNVSDLLSWEADFNHVSSQLNGGNGASGYTNQRLRNVTITYHGVDAPVLWQCALTVLQNVTIVSATGSAQVMVGGLGSTRTQVSLALGVISLDATNSRGASATAVMIGCQWNRLSISDSTNVTLDSYDGRFICNNSFMDIRTETSSIARDFTYVKGAALIQNVWERANTINSPALQIGADGAIRPFDNILDMYNTVVGERTNRAYTDDDEAVGILKRMHSRFCLWHNYNCKSDTFASTPITIGRTGNWHNRYTVGHEGNVCLTGSAGGTTPNLNGSSWLGEVWPNNAYNVGTSAVTFTDDKSGSARAGKGTYSLTGSTNAAYDRVPAGRAALAYDIAGVARLNDSHGAAGAYERTA